MMLSTNVRLFSTLQIVLSLSLASAGCSPAFYRGVSQGIASGTAHSPLTPTKLMIFGGRDHKVYLGCLNCSEYASDSVRYKYGDHGSPYSSTSILTATGIMAHHTPNTAPATLTQTIHL